MSKVIEDNATNVGGVSQVESGAFANTPGWAKEGITLDTEGDKGMSVGEALKHSDLGWTVRKVPIFGASSYAEDGTKLVAEPGAGLGDVIADRFGVRRDSDGSILGVVGNTWSPVQNSEGFALIQDFMQGDTAWIEAAGSIDHGRKVWILAHMAEDMQIAGEDVYRYVLFTNGHDGRTSVTAAMTDVRVVCQNTLIWALGGAKKSNRIHRVRHTTKATARLAEAKKILGLRDLRSEELARQGEWLVSQSMSDKQFDRFLEKLMPLDEEQEDKPAGTMIRERRSKVRSLYKGAENLNNIRGTRWGALNAVVEYSDYARGFRDDGTQLKSQFGLTSTSLKDRAAGMLLDSAPKKIVVPA